MYMDQEERLQRHLELCDRIARRLMAEGKWPWREDSPEELLHGRVRDTDTDL